MREMTQDGAPSSGVLLNVLQVAVAVCLICLAGLYLKGRNWAREASLVTPLAVEAQRNELALRSLLYEAYQWNQTHRNQDLSNFLRSLNFTIQPQGAGTTPGSPAGVAPAPRTPGR